MPGISLIEITCEKCKKTYEADSIEHIDLSEDQELIKNLKAGKANRVQCPKCKKVMYLDRSIVINFEPQSLIAVYDPQAKTDEKKEELRREYDNIIAFNEILTELAEETEFKVISSLGELKVLLDEYAKVYM
ncbi:MAG: CpXC domain-containing protein [Candidatus Thorarchaeota archaeon]|nr:CpXC domain-containing protein [Candidatus Thorarchaeota archaeon]